MGRMARKGATGRVLFLGFVFVSFAVAAQSLRFWGTWGMTVQLMPTVQIYESTLVPDCSFALGCRVKSETKFCSGGVYRYQNFYVSGSLGDIGVWEKIYFDA